MDMQFVQEIINLQLEANEKIKAILEKNYPNLTFQIAPDGDVHCWVKTEGSSREGVEFLTPVSVHDLSRKVLEMIGKMNTKVEIVAKNPKEYFLCSECGQVLPMKELEANVFAGYYCKECTKNNTGVRALINESKKAGFYD